MDWSVVCQLVVYYLLSWLSLTSSLTLHCWPPDADTALIAVLCLVIYRVTTCQLNSSQKYQRKNFVGEIPAYFKLRATSHLGGCCGMISLLFKGCVVQDHTFVLTMFSSWTWVCQFLFRPLPPLDVELTIGYHWQRLAGCCSCQSANNESPCLPMIWSNWKRIASLTNRENSLMLVNIY